MVHCTLRTTASLNGPLSCLLVHGACLQQQSTLCRMALSRPRAFPSNSEMAVFLDISAVRASSESLPAIKQSPWEEAKSTSWGCSLSGRSEDWPRRSPSNPMGLDADFRSAVAFADCQSVKRENSKWSEHNSPCWCSPSGFYFLRTPQAKATTAHTHLYPCPGSLGTQVRMLCLSQSRLWACGWVPEPYIREWGLKQKCRYRHPFSR